MTKIEGPREYAGKFEALLRKWVSAVPEVLTGIRGQIDVALTEGTLDALCTAVLNTAECLALAGHVGDASELAEVAREYGIAAKQPRIVADAKCRLAKASIVAGELDRGRMLLQDTVRYYGRHRPVDYDALVDAYIALAACCKSAACSEREALYLARALRHAARAKDRTQWRILIKTNLSDSLRRRGRHAASSRLLSEAVAIARAFRGNIFTKPQMFLDLARVAFDSGLLRKAEALARRAGSLATTAAVPHLEVRSFELQGEILARRGCVPEALTRYDRALNLARSLKLTRKVAVLLNRSGTLLLGASQFAEAERRLTESLSIHHQLRDTIGAGSDLLQIGLIYTHVNRFSDAMDCFSKCHALAESIGDRRGVIAALTNGAMIHAHETSSPASYPLAIDMLEKALKLARRLRDPQLNATILGNLGNATSAIGDIRLARRHYSRALRAARCAGDSRAVTALTMNLATVDRKMGSVVSALRLYRKACAMAHQIRAVEYEAQVYHHMGLCYDIMDDPRRALDAYLGHIRTLRLARSGLSRTEDRRTFLRTRLDGYEKAVRCCLRLAERGEDATLTDLAFFLAEEARCHGLRDALALSAENVFAVLPTRGVNPSSVKALLRSLRRRTFSGSEGSQRLLLQFFVGRETCVLFTLRSDEAHVTATLLPWNGESVSKVIYAARANDLDVVPDVFGGSSSVERRVPRLFLDFSATVMAEIKRRARPGDLLIVVPHAYLNLIPWAALVEHREEQEEWRFLIEDHAIAVAPSSHLIGIAEPCGNPKNALVVGNPSGSGLPFAEKEAETVAAILDCQPLLDSSATKAAVLAGISGNDVVHFACHGDFVGLDQKKTGLFLADGEPLTLAELTQGADWRGLSLVTLSACSTGARFPDRADDEPSMVSALLAARCASVLAALWPVYDEATATIMSDFYRNWLDQHMTKTNALRGAMLRFVEMQRQCSVMSTEAGAPVYPQKLHPWFWAGFQLWGAWE